MLRMESPRQWRRMKALQHGTRQAVEPRRTLPQKPEWSHTSALYTETGTETIISSSFTGSELY